MTALEPEFSRLVNLLEAVSDGSQALELDAAPEELARLAHRLKVERLDGMTAKIRLRTKPDGAIEVRGTVSARVVQLCVISLEPFSEDVAAEFDVVFAREASPDPKLLDPDTDPPEPLPEDGSVDLGELTVQFLALAIDPYPRKPGAVLPGGVGVGGELERTSPFSALAALKDKRK